MDEFQEFSSESPKSRGCLIFVIVAASACLLTVAGLGYVLYSIQTARTIQAQSQRAIGSVRTLNVAQVLYKEKNGSFGTLADLEREGMIDSNLGSGVKNGYEFELMVLDQGERYWIKASPLKPGDPHERRFFSNQEDLMYQSLTDFEVDNATGKPTTKLQRIGS